MTDNEQRAHDIAIAYLSASLNQMPGNDFQTEQPALIAGNKNQNAFDMIYIPIYQNVLGRLEDHS